MPKGNIRKKAVKQKRTEQLKTFQIGAGRGGQRSAEVKFDKFCTWHPDDGKGGCRRGRLEMNLICVPSNASKKKRAAKRSDIEQGSKGPISQTYCEIKQKRRQIRKLQNLWWDQQEQPLRLHRLRNMPDLPDLQDWQDLKRTPLWRGPEDPRSKRQRETQAIAKDKQHLQNFRHKWKGRENQYLPDLECFLLELRKQRLESREFVEKRRRTLNIQNILGRLDSCTPKEKRAANKPKNRPKKSMSDCYFTLFKSSETERSRDRKANKK